MIKQSYLPSISSKKEKKFRKNKYLKLRIKMILHKIDKQQGFTM